MIITQSIHFSKDFTPTHAVHTVPPVWPCSAVHTRFVTWELLPRQQIEIKQYCDFTTGKRESRTQMPKKKKGKISIKDTNPSIISKEVVENSGLNTFLL